MIKAELRLGSFIQNTPSTASSSTNAAPRRQSVVTQHPSRRAKSRATPLAGPVPAATPDDDGSSPGEANPRPPTQRPSSAWKSRNRRPRFTDNFDAFDDPVIDLDVEDKNSDHPADVHASAPAARKNSSSEPKTSLDVVKPGKDLSHTPRAWQDNSAAASTSAEHQQSVQSRQADFAKSYYGDAGRQVTSTSSENWTSSEETPKRDSVELAPDFEMSRIRDKVLEKYR